jgi:hypothetical protein
MTGSLPRTCQVCGASRTSSTCQPTWLEGKEPHAGRVLTRVRALPGARRSLRSLTMMGNSITGQIMWSPASLLVGVPPGTGGGGGAIPRDQGAPRGHAPACSLSCALPGALADDEGGFSRRVDRLAPALEMEWSPACATTCARVGGTQ